MGVGSMIKRDDALQRARELAKAFNCLKSVNKKECKTGVERQGQQYSLSLDVLMVSHPHSLGGSKSQELRKTGGRFGTSRRGDDSQRTSSHDISSQDRFLGPLLVRIIRQ